ncbi:ABC transporter permease [Curtobacterium sp. MCLR17_007]|uniref:ABC transporter permease n=1 Tax=Curtobacterium sp. MCLR17_007 TaxID=2175648 RepID=UPI000DA86118|nr:FtsX-like permease family protein [Curtobacterium sp. MCLR17_007]WIB61366.1 ABC transporter permease [Curtobacterium sp. MCLR17_007]
MNGVLTTIVGTFVESWQELRVHRGRVVLSLVGVTIAVASLAVVVGFGALAEKATAALNEQYGGRPATFSLTASSSTGDAVADEDALFAEYRAAADRYDVRWTSEAMEGPRKVQFPDGVADVYTRTVDPDYAEMHRVRMASGAWFTEDDRGRLAPAVVVNRAFLERLGDPDIVTHPTVRLPGTPGSVAVVIGEYVTSEYDTEPSMYEMARSVASTGLTADPDMGISRSFEVWVPDHHAKQLAKRIASDAERASGGAVEVSADRMDAAGTVDGDPLGPLRYVIAAVSVLVLVLGGLGLLNVSLVSVRQRIREIGIRRGVGATAGRVFVAVLLENVLGTAVAGAVGVMLGAAVLSNGTVRSAITSGADVGGAPFPLEAALVGIGAAVAVGALAGLLPALVAVRVKVIDAIRY